MQRYRDVPVLITGGLGFLGSNLAIKLVEEGARVTIVDASIAGCGSNQYNIEPVRDRVGSLDGLPRIVLRLTELRLLGGVPPDRCRVEQQLCSGQSLDARRLGVPLIPADQYSHAPAVHRERGKTQVTGGEVEFLVVKRVVRYVHFPVLPEDRAVRTEHYGRVMVKSGGPAFEYGGEYGYPVLFRYLAESLDRRARNRLCLIEQCVVFPLTKVLGAEQLGKTNHGGALGRRLSDPIHGRSEVHLGLRPTGHLDEADPVPLPRGHLASGDGTAVNFVRPTSRVPGIGRIANEVWAHDLRNPELQHVLHPIRAIGRTLGACDKTRLGEVSIESERVANGEGAHEDKTRAVR